MKHKVLILFAHPMIHRSNVNEAMIKAATNLENVTIHDLYGTYPDLFIDIQHEQRLLLSHDIIVFHFPFYWYSTPAILKVWQDLVLQYGFAYGTGGEQLANKYFMVTVTCGYSKASYEEEAINHYSVQQLLKPLEQMANFTGMKYVPPYIIYGTHRILKKEVTYYAEEYRTLLIGLIEGDICLEEAKKVSKLNMLISKLINGGHHDNH